MKKTFRATVDTSMPNFSPAAEAARERAWDAEQAEPAAMSEYRRRVQNPASSSAWDWLRLAEELDATRQQAPSGTSAYRVLARAAADCQSRAGL